MFLVLKISLFLSVYFHLISYALSGIILLLRNVDEFNLKVCLDFSNVLERQCEITKFHIKMFSQVRLGFGSGLVVEMFPPRLSRDNFDDWLS